METIYLSLRAQVAVGTGYLFHEIPGIKTNMLYQYPLPVYSLHVHY